MRPYISEQLPLWERLAKRQTHLHASESHPLVNRRLHRWQHALQDVHEESLGTRCRLAGYSLAEILSEFGKAPAAHNSRVPRSLRLRGRRRPEVPRGIDSIPFGDIVAPLADRAIRSLKKSLEPAHTNLFSSAAFDCLRTNLIENLSFISHHALLNELSILRSAHLRAHQKSPQASDTPSRVVYEALISSLTSDNGAQFYALYPVAQRLFALKIGQWKKSCSLLIRHFYEDRTRIRHQLGLGPWDVVDHISIGLSDPHRGGRSVAILRCSAGEHVVYKPRALSLETCFSRIVAYLNKNLGATELRSFRMVDCGDHGWCEYVDNSQLTDAEEIRRFFYRSGILLALLHAIRATDCHFENVACWGGFPVLLDLETLCHQENNLLFSSSDIKGPGAPFLHSVTRVGLLPAVRHDPDAMELSPLAPEAIGPQHLSRSYEHPGTDLMRLREVSQARAIPTIIAPNHSVPQETIVSELKRGFSVGYSTIMNCKTGLLQEEGLLSSARDEECRFVARNTQLYGWLSQKSLEYNFLRSGIDRSIELEGLFRGTLRGPRKEIWFKVAEAERRSLEGLDIPHFTTRLSDRHLRVNGRIVAKNVFERTPWELVAERLENMSSTDLDGQLAIIEMLFAQKSSGVRSPRPVTPRIRPSTYSTILTSCDDVANTLWRHQVRYLDGSPSWLTLHPLLKGGRYRVTPGGAGLYHGSAGIGLFYAAHFALTGKASSRDRSLAAFSNALEKETLKALLDGGHIDMGEGISGIAYALSKAADLVGVPDLHRQASELLSQIQEKSVLESSALCVVSGLAGLLLALDVVNRRTHSKQLHKMMVLAAEIITNQEYTVSENVSTWKTAAGEVLAGFAHGSAGIAFALGRAAQHLGDNRLGSLAKRGFQHAIHAYEPSLANWVEGRSQLQGEATACSWCHGAIGIGLGLAHERAESLQDIALTQSRVRQVVMQDLAKGPPTQSMCCGTAGILELFVSDSNLQLSDKLSNGIVHSLCDTDSHHCLTGNSAKVFMPGLFNGSAGLAYQLMRFSAPDRIPGVLSFS